MTAVRIPVVSAAIDQPNPVAPAPAPEPAPSPTLVEDEVTQAPADGADSSDGSSGKPPTGGKGKKPHRRHRVRNGVLIGVLVLILGIGATVGVAYAQLNGRLGHANIDSMVDDSGRPTNSASLSDVHSVGDPFAGKAVNILVIGSDSRGGTNNQLTGDNVIGERSDTTFIAHVSADRSRIDVVSIPRDTWITIPNCVYADGTRVPGSGATKQKFNAAFSFGTMGKKGTLASGVACSVKAVEAMSGVRIDAYVVVDFSGFASIINTIGGVDIYLPCAVKSPKADNLNLPKGVNHLNGTKATSYARARTGAGLGDGSDLDRIKRQQALFEAIVQKVLSLNYMTDIKTLYSFVGALADSVTTDLGNITQIAGFAYSLKNMSGSALTFTTIPVGGAGDGSSVVILTSQAKPIWAALNGDTPLSAVLKKPTSTSTSTATSTGGSGGSGGAPAGVVAAPSGQC